MDKLVIGIVGKKLAGKGSFGDALSRAFAKRVHVKRITFSDPLVETLNVWTTVETRSRNNLQKIIVALRNAFGENILSHEIKKRIENARSDIVIVDGLRWHTDIEMLRSFPRNILVEIQASDRVRYERTGDAKADEKEITFEEFLENENYPSERSIDEIAKYADFIFYNDGNDKRALESKASQFRRVLEQTLKI